MAAIATAAPAAAPPVRWTVVIAVVLTAVLEVLDSTIVNVALPHIRAALGITPDETTWVLTSYIVASVAVMPLTGYVSARLGRRTLIVTAITGFAGFSALCGLSQSIGMMVFARLGQGLFGAFLIPLSQSILFDAFPRERRGQAMALFGMGVVVAPVLGPTVGALLTEHFSWRAVFYVNLPLAALALAMILGQVEGDERRPVTTDWTGLVLMVTAIGALQMLLDLGTRNDWFQSGFIVLCAIVAAVAGAAFVWRGLRVPRNIVDFSLFGDRSFAAANVAMLGFGLAMFGAISMQPLFTQGLLGFPVITAGELFVPRGLAAGIMMVVTGNLLLRIFDPRLLVATGLILIGTGNVMLSWLNLDTGFADLVLPSVLAGAGMGLFFVPMSTVAFQHIGRDRQDEASGIYSVARSIGSSVGIAIVGWQFADRTQLHWNTLAGQVTPFNPAATAFLAPFHLTPDSAAGVARLASEVGRQAQMLAFQDAFLLTGVAAFAMLPVVLFMQRPRPGAAVAVVH